MHGCCYQMHQRYGGCGADTNRHVDMRKAAPGGTNQILPSGPVSERVNWGASRRQAAAKPPWPMATKRSPPSLKHTCAVTIRDSYNRIAFIEHLGILGDALLMSWMLFCSLKAALAAGEYCQGDPKEAAAEYVRTAWGWPQLPREARAFGRSIAHMPRGALKMELLAGGGNAPGSGWQWSVSCHRLR